MPKLMFSRPLREVCLYACTDKGACNCYARRQDEGKEIEKAISEKRDFEGFEWCGCTFCNDEDNWTMKGPQEGRVIKFHADDDPKPQAGDFLIGQCSCGCCHSGDLGACPDYTLSGNGRCVYCDHGEACHGRDIGRRFYNGPLSYGIRHEKFPRRQ